MSTNLRVDAIINVTVCGHQYRYGAEFSTHADTFQKGFIAITRSGFRGRAKVVKEAMLTKQILSRMIHAQQCANMLHGKTYVVVAVK